MPYSPLGRGFLTGAIRSLEDFEEDDYRKQAPRFQGENFDKNLQLVDKVSDMARQRGYTPAQLALAWVLAQGEHIAPIPGTKKRSRLEENLRAVEISLSADEMAQIDDISPRGAAAGERYTPAQLATVHR